jgi:TonB family protein
MQRITRILVLGAMLAAAAAIAQADDRQPTLQVKPDYPTLLKRMGIGGTVKLNALVAADGTVKKTNIAGGNPMLGEIACSAVKKWKFTPAAQSSTVPVEMVFEAKSATVQIK